MLRPIMALKKGDFIEIEFTGKIKEEGEIFDTNIEADAKKANLKIDCKPFAMSIGHLMLPKGLDADLEGKEVGKSYSLELQPEDAFGKRNPQMIRMIPSKVFHQQDINPQRGMQLSLDGQLVRVLSSSGGRVLVDFNNPLAGKEVEYKYKILKKIEGHKDKINALQDFLFRKRFDFEVKDKKVIFSVEKEVEPMIKMFAPKFIEISGLEIESKILVKTSKKKE
jgi:FKBP-type peptidyl-prolyl cis-trans isomerase 2